MLRFILAITMTAVCSISIASNWNFLKNSSIASFTSKDTEMMEATIYKALNTLKDGEKLAWKNDKSGNSGLANPLKTYSKNQKTCRTLRIINRSKTAINESEHDFCQTTEKKWKYTIKEK